MCPYFIYWFCKLIRLFFKIGRLEDGRVDVVDADVDDAGVYLVDWGVDVVETDINAFDAGVDDVYSADDVVDIRVDEVDADIVVARV